MFKRSFATTKDRAGKARKVSKRSFRDDAKQRMREALNEATTPETSPSIGGASPKLNSAIVTIVVGKDQRLFAAHEDVLSRSPWFATACRDQFFSAPGQRRISLPDEEPEVFSAVLEYLYKSDYSPRLLHDRKRNTWSLEDLQDPIMTPRSEHPDDPKKFVGFNESATIYHHGVGDYVLRDTVIYCSALRLGLPDLQRLALRKQGLQTGIDVATILRSARFAYANTPASDSRLRAHYLALIIRSRKTFKRSGTMQMEMEKGDTQFFFDLFVAMCNHIDDISEEIGHVHSPNITKLPGGLRALPRASNKPSHLFSGVWASRYPRLYDFIHRLYRIELAISSEALSVPLFLRGEHHSEKNTIFASNPLSSTAATSSKEALSHERLLPDDRPATSPVLAAAAFAQHISYGPVMYENLLLSQTAETQSYRCPSASKLGEAMVVVCAGNFVASRSLVWESAMELRSVPQYFSDPLALTFWGGDTGGACGGMQVRMDDVPRWL